MTTNQSHAETNGEAIDFPISLSYSPPQTLNLEEDDTPSSLALVSTATNLSVTVDGCSTGYTSPQTTITSGTVKLFKLDKNCLVKLQSFTIGATTYSSNLSNAIPFSTWRPPDTAVFQSTTSSTDLIKVFIVTQATAGGVLATDTIVYKFTDIQSGGTKSLPQISVSTGIPISALGNASPNFTILQARYLSTNTNGSANFSFSLMCGDTLTGSSNANYACDNVLLQSQLDYIFITDAYSQGAITVSQANLAFAANSPTSVGTSIVAPGASDLNGNTLSNGGFYTSNSSPLLTGTSAIYPANLNNVLMLRRKDASGNTMSYLYFYVNITGITQYIPVSGCGTTFAGGSGTIGDPYQVVDARTLSHVALCSSSTYFIQTQSIDLGGSATPWTPIQLSGQYNGSGFLIYGLYINSSTDAASIGVFSSINSGASVSNLTINSATLTGIGFVGALAGILVSGTVTNCSSSGSITLNNSTNGAKGGGLIGKMTGGTISSSFSSVVMSHPVSSNASGFIYSGGLVGYMDSSVSSASITSSYATGSINTSGTTSAGYVVFGGALVGYARKPGANSASISNSYSTGNVTLSSTGYLRFYIGMVGENLGMSVSGCFASGTYSYGYNGPSDYNVGGLSGVVTGTVSNSYSMVSISFPLSSGTTYVGGLIGYASGASISSSYSASPSIVGQGANGFVGLNNGGSSTFTNDYLYKNASVPVNSQSGVTSYTTTTQMQTQSNFGGFTFGTSAQNWKMPSANPLSPSGLLSPVLYWQCGSNGIVCP